MADQRPPGRRHFQGATAAGRSLARRKRSRTFVRTSARVLSAVTKTDSRRRVVARDGAHLRVARGVRLDYEPRRSTIDRRLRSEEHTSELQSLRNLVCRLLLDKKNKR